jgi:hypothetical protein
MNLPLPTFRPGRLFLLLAAACLQGCVYVPKVTEFYDRDCEIITKHMVLQKVELDELKRCEGNEACVAVLAAAGSVYTAASVVVSGSIVVVGNMAYWMEKRGQCEPVAPGRPAAGAT